MADLSTGDLAAGSAGTPTQQNFAPERKTVTSRNASAPHAANESHTILAVGDRVIGEVAPDSESTEVGTIQEIDAAMRRYFVLYDSGNTRWHEHDELRLESPAHDDDADDEDEDDEDDSDDKSKNDKSSPESTTNTPAQPSAPEHPETTTPEPPQGERVHIEKDDKPSE